MRLTLITPLLLLPLLTACGPQPPDARQWEALTTAASASGSAAALGVRCLFDTREMTAAYDRALARYVLTEAQKAELAEIAKASATELVGEPLPGGHQMCTDGAAMRDKVMSVVVKL